MKCTVAVAQIDPVLGDLRRNVLQHVEAAERASKDGADMIVFPELSLTGYSVKDLASDLAMDPVSDGRLDKIRRLSRKITIIAGGIVQGEDHGVYNAGICFDAGKVVHIHKKVYPPDYGMFEEGRYFSPGRSVRSFQTRCGRCAILICEDMWHMSLPYLAMLDGAEVVVTLTASPTRVGSSSADLDTKTVNYEHQRVYARLLSVYTVFANRTGFEDGVNFWGGSAVFSPSGEPLVEADMFEEDMILAKLDSSEVRRARRFSRHVLDERPDTIASNLRRIIGERS